MYEKSSRFTSSFLGMSASEKLPLQIKFYDYKDKEVTSYRKLQEEYINVEVERIKEKYMGFTTTFVIYNQTYIRYNQFLTISYTGNRKVVFQMLEQFLSFMASVVAYYVYK